MSYETIIYEKREKVGYITLNRPHEGNAINAQLNRDLNVMQLLRLIPVM